MTAASSTARSFSWTAAQGRSEAGSGPGTYLLDFGYSSDTLRWGIYFEVQSLTFRMADLRMDLPPQVRCADYEGTLSSARALADAASNLRLAIQHSGDLFTGLRLE